MPAYTIRVELVDAFQRDGSKVYETITSIVDEAAAVAAAELLMTDLAALTEMDILAYTVSRRVVYTDSVTGGANRDEGLTAVLRKVDNHKGTIKVPAPIDSVFNLDGTLDLTDTIVTDFFGNFLTTGQWTFSDGEQASSLVSGRLDE